MHIRVLLADPDESLLLSYGAYLVGEGFEVATATTGLDCVAQLRGFRPDVLVLEPELPWGWGDGVLAVMQDGSDVPLIPVLLLSAWPTAQNQDQGLAYPLKEYEYKPVTPDRLANRIRRLFDRTQPVGGFFG